LHRSVMETRRSWMTRPWLSVSREAGVTAADAIGEEAAICTLSGYTVSLRLAAGSLPEGRTGW